LHQPIGHFNQMLGLDRKYNDHAWWKVKMTNIKNEDWVFEVLDVLAICDVKMTLVISLFNLDF
jgi:hypothetical protein